MKLLLGIAGIAFLVGGAATVVGIGGLVSDPDAVPTCDGKVMSVGELCEITRGGSLVDSYTYQEKLERQRANKDSGGNTLVIGLTVIGVSLLGGALVEIRFRRSNRRRTQHGAAAAITTPSVPTPLVPTPSVPVPSVPTQSTAAPPTGDSGAARNKRLVVITAVLAWLCVATAVVVGVVVILDDRSDSSEPSASQAAAASSEAAYARHTEALMAAMPETLRAATQRCEPGYANQHRALHTRTCYLAKGSPLVAGLAAHEGMAGIFEVGKVNGASYADTMRYEGKAFLDDSTRFAVFYQDPYPSGQPGLGNYMQYLDRRTGLWLQVSYLVTVQDAETFLARAGF
ncbi:hypothetical protein NN3_16340 [Nocardia neocaledoniensis NBRC 108232]|uniref:hypothetical protein n=1 Tax=Nocardia neocaledoniensis TaxID=236511 RepID=UPI000D717397|nr:hypothetical protein [Nocardia neocaledoniensis]GEM30627.1 hypothetical protein NN3_16340 [Nocardia neocaledoniensis NBRC 108232]